MCFNLLGSWLGVPGLKFGVQGLGPKLKVHGLGFRSLATDAVSAQEFYILFSPSCPIYSCSGFKHEALDAWPQVSALFAAARILIPKVRRPARPKNPVSITTKLENVQKHVCPANPCQMRCFAGQAQFHVFGSGSHVKRFVISGQTSRAHIRENLQRVVATALETWKHRRNGVRLRLHFVKPLASRGHCDHSCSAAQLTACGGGKTK